MPSPWTIIGWLVLFALVAALAYVAMSYAQSMQPATPPMPKPDDGPKPFEPDDPKPAETPTRDTAEVPS